MGGSRAGPGSGPRRRATGPVALLLLGLAIRESLAFWTGHPYDFEIWIRTAAVVGRGGNPYAGYWPAVPGVSIAFFTTPLPPPAYPPFWPLVLGGLFRAWEATGGGNRFVLYGLLKQPVVLGDLASGWLLYRLVQRWGPSEAAARAALAVWMLFPYTLIAGTVWGQFDPIVLALVLAGLMVEETRGRTVLDGLGIFVKWFTAIFLPLEFFRASGWRRLWVVAGLVLPVLLTLLAFGALGWSLSTVLPSAAGSSAGDFASDGGGMNVARWLSIPAVAGALAPAPWVYDVLSFVWVPAVVVAGLVAARWARADPGAGALRAVLFVTTVFLATRFGLNEQYFVYLFGLLIVDLFAFHPGRQRLFVLLAGVAGAYLVVNNDLLIWFLAPISPAYWSGPSDAATTGTLGALRSDVLLLLATGVTLALLRLALALYRDEGAPLARGPRPAAGSDAVAPSPAGPSGPAGSAGLGDGPVDRVPDPGPVDVVGPWREPVPGG